MDGHNVQARNFPVVSSLNRFGAYPLEGHLDLAVYCFGYVKTTQDK